MVGQWWEGEIFMHWINPSIESTIFGGKGAYIWGSGEGDKSLRESIAIYVPDRPIEVSIGGKGGRMAGE